MTILVTIAFLMAVAGCFLMLGLSPFTFLDGLAGYLKRNYCYRFIKS